MEMSREREAVNHPKEGTMSRRKLFTLLAALTLVAPLMFYGCSGDDGADGAPGAPGKDGQNLTATAKPETCAICHPGAGDKHQEFYDDLYQDGVIKIANLQYGFTDNNDVVTFEMTKNGVEADCTKVTNLNIYFAPYNDNGLFQFTPSRGSLTIKGINETPVDNALTGTLVYDSATGVCTSTKPSFDNVSLATKNGEIVLYGYDELIGLLPPSRVRMVSYPYAALLETGTVDYASAANVSGCEKCHIIPFLKHGNILGQVNKDPATDFITCKACHLDDRPGGHQMWQLLVDDTPKAADYFAQAKATPSTSDGVETFMTDAEKAKYAYKTSLMNDVHMSHAMEFEYPQSMATCATCHAGKLDKIFADNNFVLETCKSCHPETGSAQAEKMQGLGLAAILPSSHISGGLVSPARVNCYTCHAGGFKTVTGHTGYDKIIYATDNGVKYSSGIAVTIDNASFDNNILTFGFHATGTAGGLAAADIKPTVLVGLYGYDTKDFIIGPHESSGGRRLLEYNIVPPVSGTLNSNRITLTGGAGSWNATANLSDWAGMIDNGVVKRVEIGVMPALSNADNVVVALNAPSRTFNLGTKTFTDSFYPAIVKVATGCNNCHDALAVNFHSPDRGGNIVVCRLCHITKAGASHLEMQSRSIDSYAHAIHTFQPFDIQNVNFDNAVQSMFYDLKIESQYPTFDRRNCVSCHNAGRFNVPDQDKSLPGILSSSRDSNATLSRAIVGVPSHVTGPGSRACGACHRAIMIKEDQFAELTSFNQHTNDGGYLLVPGTVPALIEAINAILPMFNDGSVVVTP